MKSHKDFIQDFSSNLFARLITETFTSSYVQSHVCPDCSSIAKERCHGIGEERPVLIKRALRRCKAKAYQPIHLKDILIAFLEEHKSTRFTFKCSNCHKKETSILLRNR